jgi:MoxR-like ATPase
MKTKIKSLLTQLNQGLLSREQVLKMGLLTLLSGENLVLVGPPGTGKSLVARRIAKSLADNAGQAGKADYFEYLLTKFSTPEEIFGPLSISALKADQFKRNTEGYLPTVRMAFLDEIFKASSSILNALLTILNERVYHNGAQAQKVPLQALIAASNELPNDQEELSALYDRFLVRVFVDYVGLSQLPQLFEPTTEPELAPADLLSVQDLAQIQHSADQVHIAPELIAAVQDIWAAHQEAFKEDRRESLSDRRLKKIIHLLRVSAATNGREAVDLSDLVLLKDCLWNHPDNAEKVLELLMRTLQNHSRQVPSNGVGTVALESNSVALSTAASAKKQPSKSDTVVKGYSGSGTADDPLLIQTAEDLAELARPEVGQQGYHFRQTTDLDISHISTWPKIVFKGHYDGRSFKIQQSIPHSKNGMSGLFAVGLGLSRSRFSLFEQLNQSTVKQLKTFNCRLAEVANDSSISCCESHGSSLSKTAKDSCISRCESHGSNLLDEVQGCKVEDCATFLPSGCFDGISFPEGVCYGGIVTTSHTSSLHRCFVTGEIPGISGSGGIVFAATSSEINCCAIGSLKTDDRASGYQRSRVCGRNYRSKFSKNIALDSVHIHRQRGTDDEEGESIASTFFKQRYFENVLGWDFDTVWVWNDQENRPVLRDAGTSTSTTRSAPVSSNPNRVDLLTQQVQANIWL